MTTIAKVVEHSITTHGASLRTIQLQYPRFIHAELMTHRAFSRNASSSRAIPVKTMIDRTLADPAFFDFIGQNQPGMQAACEVDAATGAKFKEEWEELGRIVAGYSSRWANVYQIHKQTANRALEPWQHIHVVVSVTDAGYENWKSLRAHKDAQPEIHVLADVIEAACAASTPVLRHHDRDDAANWHLPYVSLAERIEHAANPVLLAQISAARCARTSHMNHDGTNPVIARDLQLFSDLVGAEPLHASPVEHQGYPLPLATQRSNNFVGWRQFRELVDAGHYRNIN